MRVVFANGVPLFHYAMADKAAAHYSMVQIVESGLASQQEVAAAFDCSRLTIFRSQKKFDKGGVVALVPKKTGPKDGHKINKAKSRHIVALNTYSEPFLALKNNEQRNIIEQLLGITLLSEKAEVIKGMVRDSKDSIQQEEFNVKAIEEANNIEIFVVHWIDGKEE
jgi:hypothetical protein